MPEPTRVISVRGKDPAVLRADAGFVYVGRQMYFQGWSASKWANPYRIGVQRSKCGYIDPELQRMAEDRMRGDGLVGAAHYCRILDEIEPGLMLVRYRQRLDKTGLIREVGELRGKVLGCWCGSWQPGEPEIACHAVVLAKLVNALVEYGDGAGTIAEGSGTPT